MAKDSFKREIDYLRISITDKCNLGCTYCMPQLKPKTFKSGEVLTGEEILRLVRVAAGMGVRKVRLTGGEPLLRDDIIELVRGIKEIGVPDLALTTNGMFLGHRAHDLKEAGLDRLNVSLDSMSPERFKKMTGGGDLEQVLSGIAAAEEVGLTPIKLNIVPVRGVNDDEVVDFARMTLDRPVHVRFIELMPSRRDWEDINCVKSDEVQERIEKELGPLEKRQFKGKGPSRNFRLKGAAGIVGFISAVSHSFCYECNRLRITAVGKIRPCLFSKTEIDMLSPIRDGADDAEIQKLFQLAIDTKPEGNYLKDPADNDAVDSMSSIGG
jgi:cyclic pyranopterin phosphate synthase